MNERKNMVMEISFVTSNQEKVKAVERSLAYVHRSDIKIKKINLDIVEPQFDNVVEISKYKAVEISKYKAMAAFKLLHSPVLVEDGGLVIPALDGFPGPYTKYVLKTIGVDGILRLLSGISDRSAKFVSFATFVDAGGRVQQFERRGDNFEIACERKDIVHPEAWSDLWQVIYLKKYGKSSRVIGIYRANRNFRQSATICQMVGANILISYPRYKKSRTFEFCFFCLI